MQCLRLVAKPVAVCLITALAATSLPSGVARAAMVSTAHVLAPAADAQRAELVAQFAREDVQRALRQLGVDPHEAAARVASLSDAEVARIAAQFDQLPAGGWIGALVGAALIVFLVLLVTDLLGLTDVYPFVKK